MAAHNDIGKAGEELAATWLPAKGFLLLHRNWRHKNLEVDVIASRNNVLHFIEVKCRASSRFGYPEDAMTRKKIQNLINAAEQFVFLNPSWTKVQFDVLSITLGDNEHEYFFIEDIYE